MSDLKLHLASVLPPTNVLLPATKNALLLNGKLPSGDASTHHAEFCNVRSASLV